MSQSATPEANPVVKPLCFVIGPIGRDTSPERKHSDMLLHSVIREVLQRPEHNYRVKRADDDVDPGMIGDRVVHDIINADLVVADLTDLNPNAFYELGIRHSIEKPVIHIAKIGTPLPFDNNSHRTIFVDVSDWHSIEGARVRLSESAKSIHIPGFRVSNPITQANASFKMKQSADPKDSIIADLQNRLEVLERATPISFDHRSMSIADAEKSELARTLAMRQFEQAAEIYSGMVGSDIAIARKFIDAVVMRKEAQAYSIHRQNANVSPLRAKNFVDNLLRMSTE